MLCDVACQKLLKLVGVLRNYSKNISGLFFWDMLYMRDIVAYV